MLHVVPRRFNHIVAYWHQLHNISSNFYGKQRMNSYDAHKFGRGLRFNWKLYAKKQRRQAKNEGDCSLEFQSNECGKAIKDTHVISILYYMVYECVQRLKISGKFPENFALV